jgi:hypothetical protein
MARAVAEAVPTPARTVTVVDTGSSSTARPARVTLEVLSLHVVFSSGSEVVVERLKVTATVATASVTLRLPLVLEAVGSREGDWTSLVTSSVGIVAVVGFGVSGNRSVVTCL